MKLNNKGQVLVTFILLLTFLFTLAAIMIDLGVAGYNKRNIESSIKETLEYGIKNIDKDPSELKEKLDKLLVKNIKNIGYKKVTINNDNIKIRVSTSIDGAFSNVINLNIYELDITYTAYADGRLEKG